MVPVIIFFLGILLLVRIMSFLFGLGWSFWLWVPNIKSKLWVRYHQQIFHEAKLNKETTKHINQHSHCDQLCKEKPVSISRKLIILNEEKPPKDSNDEKSKKWRFLRSFHVMLFCNKGAYTDKFEAFWDLLSLSSFSHSPLKTESHEHHPC